MIYGQQFRDNAANSTLINLPAWYIDGLVAYLSKDWDFETENRVKDGVVNGKYKNSIVYKVMMLLMRDTPSGVISARCMVSR